MKLQLGVNDVAYSDPDASGATTTGQVAEILEQKYHVMRVFVELSGQKIADQLAHEMSGALKSLEQGKPAAQVFKAIKMDKVEKDFRDYLDADTWQKVSGQTIAAAAAGVSHRFKKPREERVSRPAFIDTGLYQSSFRARLK